MATLILRPSGDINISNYSTSGASTGYDCINDTTADQDSTMLTIKTSGSSSNVSANASFYMAPDSTPDSSTYVKVDSISVLINGTQDGKSSNNDDNWTTVTVKCTNTNKSGSVSSLQLSTGGWANKTGTISASTLGLTDIYQLSELATWFQTTLDTKAHTHSIFVTNYTVKISQMYIIINYTAQTVTSYNCNLTAKTGITTVKSSGANPIMSGKSVTCTATPAAHYTFKGWYSDENGTNLVSTANPYTFNIAADTNLYAFGEAIIYNATVGNASSLNGAAASASPATGGYGDTVTYTCTVSDNSKEFYGWYADADFKNMVSSEPTYTVTFADANIALYARVGKVRTKVTLRPSQATDPYPFRWNGNNTDLTTPTDVGPSCSLVQNYSVLKTNTYDSATTYAYQVSNKRDSWSAKKTVMVLQVAEGAKNIPENAILTNCEMRLKYSYTNPSFIYEDHFVAFGLIDYIPNDAQVDYDETPIRYVRGIAEFDPNATSATYSEMDISINRWTAQEIREGHFGVSIEHGNNGSSTTQLNVYALELDIYYILPDEMQYLVQAIGDDNTRVQVATVPNVEMINLISNSYVAGNTEIVVPVGAKSTVSDDSSSTARYATISTFTASDYKINLTNLYNTSMDISPMTGEIETYYDLMTPYYTEMYGFEPGGTYTVTGNYTLTSGVMRVRWGCAVNSTSAWTHDTVSNDFAATNTLAPFSYTFTIPEGAHGFWIRLQMYDGTTKDTLYFTDLSIKGPRFTPELLVQDITTEYVAQGGTTTLVAKPKGGYRFDGWYSDPDYTQLVSNDATYTVSNVQAATTLYAKSNYYCDLVKRTLSVPFGAGATYFTGIIYDSNTGSISNSGVASGTNGFTTDLDLTTFNSVGLNIAVEAACASYNGSFDVGAQINSAGMKILYPNATAHPVKADWYLEAGRGSASYKWGLFSRQGAPLSPYESVTPCFDRRPLVNFYPARINGVPFARNNMYATALLNTTRSSTIEYRFKIHEASRALAIGVDSTELSLYFEQYKYHAVVVDGSQGVQLNSSYITIDTNFDYTKTDTLAVSDTTTGYEGDKLMLILGIDKDATMEGIYEDAELTKSLSDYGLSGAAGVLLSNGTREWQYSIPYDKLYQDFTIYIKTQIYRTLSVQGDEYTTATTTASGSLINGTEVTITAIPNAGCIFTGWYDSDGMLVSTQEIYTFNINKNYELTAKSIKTESRLYVGDKPVKITVRRGT